MRSIGLAALGLLGAAQACSASDGGSPGSGGSAGSGAAGGSAGSGGSSGSAGTGVFDAAMSDGKIDPDAACAQFSAEAKQSPAAMMVVLDRSSSMTTNGKWAAAQQAIVQAIDTNAFDDISLGLIAYPAFQVASPQCIAILAPTVSCGISNLPQVPLGDTGTAKSNAPAGVRKDIYNWLVGNGPDNTQTDASPGYEAMKAAINSLRNFPITGKRLMLFITDGGFSCASLFPARMGYSDGLCPDWEQPSAVVSLLDAAYKDATAPVQTFVVGVPGSNSAGQMQGPYATAPYHMRLALSTYAYTGSPTTVPSNCDGTTFNQNGGDPSVPCHYDMSSGTFDANALAQTISDIRGKALGCTFQLPTGNGPVDKNKVNVTVTVGGMAVDLKQQSATGACLPEGCWNYTSGAQDQVELIGKACDDVKNANDAKVDIVVGCPTQIVG